MVTVTDAHVDSICSQIGRCSSGVNEKTATVQGRHSSICLLPNCKGSHRVSCVSNAWVDTVVVVVVTESDVGVAVTEMVLSVIVHSGV